VTFYELAILNTARRIRRGLAPFDFFTASSVLGAAFAKIPHDVASDLLHVVDPIEPVGGWPREDAGDEEKPC
jgi:hypothetical protein